MPSQENITERVSEVRFLQAGPLMLVPLCSSYKTLILMGVSLFSHANGNNKQVRGPTGWLVKPAAPLAGAGYTVPSRAFPAPDHKTVLVQPKT